jgi:hypothetical protein
LGIAGLTLFLVPPIGLGASVAGLVVTLSKFSERRRFSRLALGLSIAGLVAFASFWGFVWLVSQ